MQCPVVACCNEFSDSVKGGGGQFPNQMSNDKFLKKTKGLSPMELV
jgi:hypothetical protein